MNTESGRAGNWTRVARKSGIQRLLKRTLSLTVAAALTLPAQVANAGTTYTYDALGRVISARQDDGRQTVYVYDAAGNRLQTIVSGSTLNRAPIAVPDTITLFENQASFSIDPTLNDSDPDGTALALFSVADGSYGIASRNVNILTYASSWHRNATDTLVYTITDGQGLSASGRIAVTLANLPPVAVTDSVVSLMNAGLFLDPIRNDTDPGRDPLKLTSVSAPSHGTATLDVEGLAITYVPVADYVGADAFTYVVSDTDGGTSVGTVNVNVVANTPPPPTATPDQVTLQGSASSGDVTPLVYDPRLNDADPLGALLRIVFVTQPTGGTVEIIDGGTGLRITSIGGAPLSTIGPFTYTIADGLGRQASATVSSTIVRN